ncbi:MAG: hypothetical protein Q8N01_06625 [Sulfuricurvum sp.]|nr:hypothetical protein [Sulfuricurvum sp.]
MMIFGFTSRLLLGVFILTVPLSANVDDLFWNRYYELKKNDLNAAYTLLEEAIEKNPTNPQLHEEIGYLLIQKNNSESALVHFQKSAKLDPSNEKIQLQTAYLLQSTGKNTESCQLFKRLKNSADTSIQLKACEGFGTVEHFCDHQSLAPYFIDFMTSPTYYSRFDDLVVPAILRVGKYYDVFNAQIYGISRLTHDTESRGGHAPVIYSDNVVTFGVGASIQPVQKIPLRAYMEYGYAYDTTERNRSRTRDDFRAGLTFFDSWVPKPKCGSESTWFGTRAGNLYMDVSYYSRYDDMIGYFRYRDGLSIFEKEKQQWFLFGRVFVAADSKGEYYNNIIEVGPTLSYVPDYQMGLSIEADIIKGYYIGPMGSNPYGTNYDDFRLSVNYRHTF